MNLIGFFLAITPIAISPGASFTLAFNNALHMGRRGVWPVIIGTGLGILTHALAAGIGITQVISHHPQLLKTLTLMGQAYLLYLAIRLLINGIKKPTHKVNPTLTITRTHQAYLLNVLNIKALLVYLVIVPQFIGIHLTLSHFFILGGIHILVMGGWLIFMGTIIEHSIKRFNPDLLRRVIGMIAGTLLVAIVMSAYIRF